MDDKWRKLQQVHALMQRVETLAYAKILPCQSEYLASLWQDFVLSDLLDKGPMWANYVQHLADNACPLLALDCMKR